MRIKSYLKKANKDLSRFTNKTFRNVKIVPKLLKLPGALSKNKLENLYLS